MRERSCSMYPLGSFQCYYTPDDIIEKIPDTHVSPTSQLQMYYVSCN